MINISTIRHAIVLKFLTFNIFGCGLLIALFQAGWVTKIYQADVYHIIKIMVLIFALGMWTVGQRIFALNKILNTPALPSTSAQVEAAKLRLGQSSKFVSHLASTLLFMGLLGTMLGFYYATNSIDQKLISDASQVGPMVAGLLNGVSLKLLSSIVGTALCVWLIQNGLMISQTNVEIVARMIEAEKS